MVKFRSFENENITNNNIRDRYALRNNMFQKYN